MNNKTTTETRDKVFMILFEKWLEHDDAQMATDQIMQLIAKEKKALLERVGREVIGEDEDENRPHHTFDLDARRRNEVREEQRNRLQKLESEIEE